ncbi:aminoglycoside phosphotransferase family protein [Alkalicoccus daliensis]|uniref:Phosphotransferase enzyme family protein n=1 Tax=Alkalicoccus daliensis TaxID=745820 RepID=A0A1H0D6N0_9BACI|nr:aminoglycoside phosphotransferase family protein [Alkalicoccus daliensis]SDN65591.1 Phosphotransferase enzyme family protein [Alkalicoccus daliensis]
MKDEFEKEELLAGGNVSQVYKSGKTVRRKLHPNSDKIHELLAHLEKKKFHYAPKFLGIDDKEREVLTFIEGEAGNYPLKDYMWSDKALTKIAEMLRYYHNAVRDFTFSDDWKPMDNTPGPFEIICHNDFAIYNMIFREEFPVGIIDFDAAAPGPKVWDLAYCLYTCVPLSRFHFNEAGIKVYYDASRDAAKRKQRIKLFFAAYGEPSLKAKGLETVVQRLKGLCMYMERKSQEGDSAFRKMIEEGHYEHYQKDIEFIQQHGKDWFDS